VLAIAQSITKNSLNIDSLAEYLGRVLPQLNKTEVLAASHKLSKQTQEQLVLT
jgi:hypothetical protein